MAKKNTNISHYLGKTVLIRRALHIGLLSLFLMVACDNEEKSPQDILSVYTPFEGKKVKSILITNSKTGNESTIDFSYDAFGRVSTMSKNNNSYSFIFDTNSVLVNKNNSKYCQGNFDEHGYIAEIINKDVLFEYNNSSFMTTCYYSAYSFKSKYNSKNNQTEISTISNGTTTTQYYSYSNYENKANIDLNAIISSCFSYEAWFGDYGILSPFSLCGNRSANLISQEIYNNVHTYNISYELDQEQYPVKISVKDNATVNNNGTTIYIIIYE